ncbi:hypothetical protein Daus18300_003477 [Diaporthe australafricana]|uniref:Uncharacterized protein n=1 Tax=Diaporthe australafricana TaxID=127596 RepID=A0ABR3XFQ9_9PEZI
MADHNKHFDMMASESMPSYSNTEDDDPDPWERIYESGVNSPGTMLPDSWKDPPVGYVPATWPTGPRDLPSGHYTCPIEGCKNPVGPSESDQGYIRTTLGPHILSHAGDTKKHIFVDDLRLAVRRRVVALRRDMECPAEDVINMFYYRGDAISSVQAKVDDMITDLAELRNWEQSSRHIRGRAELIDSMKQRAADERSAILQDSRLQRLAELADYEGVLYRSWHGFRLNWSRPRRFPETHRSEEVRGRLVVPGDFRRPSSPQEMETDFDQSVPRKKARKSLPELDGSNGDSPLADGDDPMEGSY